jgi:hypothetical protein
MIDDIEIQINEAIGEYKVELDRILAMVEPLKESDAVAKKLFEEITAIYENPLLAWNKYKSAETDPRPYLRNLISIANNLGDNKEKAKEIHRKIEIEKAKFLGRYNKPQ